MTEFPTLISPPSLFRRVASYDFHASKIEIFVCSCLRCVISNVRRELSGDFAGGFSRRIAIRRSQDDETSRYSGALLWALLFSLNQSRLIQLITMIWEKWSTRFLHIAAASRIPTRRDTGADTNQLLSLAHAIARIPNCKEVKPIAWYSAVLKGTESCRFLRMRVTKCASTLGRSLHSQDVRLNASLSRLASLALASDNPATMLDNALNKYGSV